ncbi:sugar ABC transporter permease [Metabacillus sp. GX 13764]|uniref:carbohydrate ABC transporter permease n=1 Tax=Metabacillus kandeliae TaxID=2900151 RepID=UPI001E3C1E86|nr:sugar ABC transporter permease [Metabacillus kandeliae]MCD7034633.1 sugar ABC transporter permease [Metabacillus kandeliae]
MRYSKSIYLFFLPGLLLFAVFFLLPLAETVFYSFTSWDGYTVNPPFTGLKNYTRLIVNDSIFHQSFWNNAKFMLFTVILQTVLSLILALYLLKNSKASIFFRALFFFPTILSSVAVAFLWSFVYDPSLGLLNQLLKAIHLDFLALNWIGDPKGAIFSLAFVQVWSHIGQMIVLFVAGMQAIPAELYESAALEGGSKWDIFKKITWPLLAPTTTIVVAYTTIQSFKAFDLIFAMTRGGPNYSTEILSTFIYHAAFENYQFGYASAASVLFMILIGVLTFIQFKLLRSNNVTY